MLNSYEVIMPNDYRDAFIRCILRYDYIFKQALKLKDFTREEQTIYINSFLTNYNKCKYKEFINRSLNEKFFEYIKNNDIQGYINFHKKQKQKEFIQQIFSLKNIENYKVLKILGKEIKINSYKLLYKNLLEEILSLQEKSKYIEILNNISNIEIRPNSVLLIEPNDVHGEVIPGYVKYLLDLGYNVDVIHYQVCQNPLCRLSDSRIRIFNLNQSCINILLAMKKCAEYSFIFSTSYNLYNS